MAPGDATLPATRRTRRSIGAHTDVNKAFAKENATTDVTSSLAASRKKSRSKSLGPGGLDALMKANGNRRASIAAPTKAPRSILKPTMPIPEIPPLKPRQSNFNAFREPTQEFSTPTLSGSKIALKTEEEQQAAAREREERERRDARRKSLANRRVSFAAEATLHTFHEVEFNQDSTTSTDSTRRNSAAAQQREREEEDKKNRRSSGPPQIDFHESDDDTATTLYSSDSEPADAVEEVADVEEDGDDDSSESDDGTMMTIDDVTGTTAASDRSVNFDDGESSTLDEALRQAARRAGNQQLEDDEDDDDFDDDEEFIPSFGWGKDANKQNIAAKDQENLPPPSRPQPKQSIHDATETNMSMDMDIDMTRAVGGILKPQPTRQYDPDEDMSMDVTRVVGGILKRPSQEHNPDEDMSMDVTRAFGGIVSPHQNASTPVDDEEEEEDDAPMEEATMEFTTAIGGIQRPAPIEEDDDDSDGNENMSMELTTVIGGVLAKNKRKSIAASPRGTVSQPDDENDDEAPMDMTLAVGQILSKPDDDDPEDDEDEEGDATMGMDMTAAIGSIISKVTGGSRDLGKRVMEEEADSAANPDEAIEAVISKSAAGDYLQPPTASEKQTTTPSPRPSRSPASALRSAVNPKIPTPQRASRNSRTPSPVKATPTPQSAKVRTPASAKPATPQLDSIVSERTATPRSRQRDPRSVSSKRPSSARIARADSRTPSPVKPTPKKTLFQNNSRNGSRTPTVTLTPQRQLSGLGADRPGLGSPQVTALFDRRGSIGDVANNFVPGKRGVMFEDPKEMTQDMDREAREEEEKENRRRILEREADGVEATLNLREMIDRLSPKRKPLKGRKSLHVGSAKGLLGKRPNELDDEEEAEENYGVKRLKGHQGSPVKNIRLQQPPSKEETTGRLNLSFRKSLLPNTVTPTLSSPAKSDAATTPRHQGRFKDVVDDRPGHQVDFDETPVEDAEQMEDEVEAEVEADGERIHLQDFLNMTSIRFMELTTTKRRHTQAPGTLEDGFLDEDEEDLSLERCVVAGACTVPMLELYRHSCRELKKYISEGRRIVKEIETDTFEDNPQLFKEYMAATPDVKTLMDKQFMNVKNHARLLSKAMWYEWRMKLQEGLKQGLVGIDEGMESDKELLDKQKSLLDSVLPAIVERYKSLVEESDNLEEVAREIADCDPADLEAARDELASLDEDVEYKKKRIAELRKQFQASEVEVEDLNVQKQNCVDDIAESERIREECRGWTSKEVNSLKARVDAIEKQHGWTVTGISGTVLSMSYKREIEIVFDITAFQEHQPNSTINLWYIAVNREQNPLPKTAEKEFFLQTIRDYARALPHNRTEVSHLLRSVQAAWNKASVVSSQIGRLNATFPTTVQRTSDSSISITTSLLLVPLESRVEVKLNLHTQIDGHGLEMTLKPEAKVVYGEHFNVPKVADFLITRIGKTVGAGEEQWDDVMVELQGRLIARGRKA
ncbi:hypothetical protein FPOA_00678 [Fusarium poae]|uniref:Spc7 kinetochore protein domain-containing protein n=1 Tax=Fusarium poae TaxID=36050 RepID=A0A1B8B1Z1_FUSPO|nr:hypothetical protein FPOA_00678 [Fusarium poae]